jgi:hypothetical protein
LGARALGIDVGGLICTNTTWTPAGSPYVLTGSRIVIVCNAPLTIEPGVVVTVSPTLAMTVGSIAFGKGIEIGCVTQSRHGGTKRPVNGYTF